METRDFVFKLDLAEAAEIDNSRRVVLDGPDAVIGVFTTDPIAVKIDPQVRISDRGLRGRMFDIVGRVPLFFEQQRQRAGRGRRESRAGDPYIVSDQGCGLSSVT